MVRSVVIAVVLCSLCPIAYAQRGGAGSQWNQAPTLHPDRIEQLTGAKGELDEKKHVFTVSVPRTDLKVVAAGVSITPAMGLSCRVAFQLAFRETLVMGDLALLEDQVDPVMGVALDNGLQVTALHNHFLRDSPRVMFMHIAGMDSESRLAAAVGKVLAKVRETSRPWEGVAPAAEIDPARTTLDPAKVDAILGARGELKEGVYRIAIGSATSVHGVKLHTAMGLSTWAAFAGSDEKALVVGDFALTESESQDVLKSLHAAGIEVVAIHQDMMDDSPRTMVVHYWGVGRTVDLARSVRAAVDKIKHKPFSNPGGSSSLLRPERLPQAVSSVTQNDDGNGR
jgi:hypothetical protein